MANFYSDSHNQRWGVMMQEKSMSCGPACVAMSKVYYTSSITANLEAEVRRISQNYPGAFTEIGGTSLKNLVSVLRAEGIKTYDAIHVGRIWDYLYTYAKDNTPVIVHIQWPGTVSAPGARTFASALTYTRPIRSASFLTRGTDWLNLRAPNFPATRSVTRRGPSAPSRKGRCRDGS